MNCPEQLLKRLQDCPADVPKFDFAGQSFFARLSSLYDADTYWVVTDVFDKLYKLNIRVLGIDSAEMKTKDPVEKALAMKARDYVAAWALPSEFHVGGNHTEKDIKLALQKTPVIVYVKCQGNDLYGRCLAHVYKDDGEDAQSISDLLIQENLVDAYQGGTKVRSWAK